MVLALQPFHPGPGKVPAWPGSRGDESSPAGKPARLFPSPKLQKEREQRTDLKVREVDLGYAPTGHSVAAETGRMWRDEVSLERR